MARVTRRHPLQSWLFWSLVLCSVTTTIAWKMNKLPFRAAHRKPRASQLDPQLPAPPQDENVADAPEWEVDSPEIPRDAKSRVVLGKSRRLVESVSQTRAEENRSTSVIPIPDEDAGPSQTEPSPNAPTPPPSSMKSQRTPQSVVGTERDESFSPKPYVRTKRAEKPRAESPEFLDEPASTAGPRDNPFARTEPAGANVRKQAQTAPESHTLIQPDPNREPASFSENVRELAKSQPRPTRGYGGNPFAKSNTPDGAANAENSANPNEMNVAEAKPNRAKHSSPFGPVKPEFESASKEVRIVREASTDSVTPIPEWVPEDNGILQVAGEQAVKRTPLRPTASSANAAPVDFQEIDQLRKTGDPADEIEAHFQLSTVYWKSPDQRPQLMERLEALSDRIYFNPTPHYMEPYVVQPGDTLAAIAKKYAVSYQYLAKLNGVEPKKIRPGQKLKVIQGPISAVVSLSAFEITIHAHGHFVARYEIGIGKDGSSPVGKFSIQEKLEDPTYYGPNGLVIDHDDPTNPLGERWLAIGEGFGIHGTIEPDSIGKASSRGCIRLRNEDIADVFDLLTVGSEIVIRK